MAEPLPSWWPEPAVRCFTDLRAYRLVGASACADRITEAIAALAAAADAEHLDVTHALREAGRRFAALKPDTALYVNSLEFLLRGTPDAAQVVERAAMLTQSRATAQQRIATGTAAAIAEAKAILIHDYSSAVLSALRELQVSFGQRRVVVSECALLGAGPRVARAASDMGHHVVYAADCSIGRLMPDIDVFVTGVESFFRDGSLANTVGTLAIALLCREFGTPVIAPAELLKLDRASTTADTKALRARLLHDWPADPWVRASGCTVEDHVLDALPARLVTKYVTESGLLSPETVGTVAVSAPGQRKRKDNA